MAVERPAIGALSRVNVLDVGEGGRPALLLEDAEGDAGLDCPLAPPPKVGGDGENVVQVNGGRRGAAPFSCPQSFPFGTGLGLPPSVSVSGRSFAGGLWDAFSAYPSQQSDGGVLARGRIGAFSAFTPFAPFRPFGRPEFRTGRRGAGGRSDARTWPIRGLGGVAGDPFALAQSPGPELPLRPARGHRVGQRMNQQRNRASASCGHSRCRSISSAHPLMRSSATAPPAAARGCRNGT